MEQQIRLIVDILNQTISTGGTDIKRAEDELVEYSKSIGWFFNLIIFYSYF
jgi:hypothetical protein